MLNLNINSKLLTKLVAVPLLVLLFNGTANASCQSEDAVCKRKCLAENFGNLTGQLSCNLECGNETIQCYKGGTSTRKTNSYSQKTYEAPTRNTYKRQNSYTSPTPTYNTSTYSSNSETNTRSRSELKSALSQKGSADAKSCISSERGRVGGQDNIMYLKNSCSKAIKYAWCYTSVSSGRNLYKCDNAGKYSFSGSNSVGSFDKTWLQGSAGAQVKYGVCMKDVSLDGKTYGHIQTERTGANRYKCNYSSYGT